jgi:cysteine desulfuration protein SufE
MNKNISEIQKDIVNEFELFDEWDEKYAYIIELGKKLEPLPEKFRTKENIIKGCQSTVWLGSEMQNDGTLKFFADSDAIIVKGLISMLIRVFSKQRPEEIVKNEPFFIDSIGMQQHLSMTRSNGLASMVKQMKMEALAFQQNSL